jgi:hypothetical protein
MYGLQTWREPFNGWVPVSGIIDLEWDVDFVWGGCAGREPCVMDYGRRRGVFEVVLDVN